MGLKLIFHRAKKLILTLFSISIFIEGAIVIIITQATINFLYRTNPVAKQRHLNKTKQRFILLLITILTVVAPSGIRITTDNATISKGTFFKDAGKGRIVSKLKPRSVIISNHQIYTDWVFLWWLAYTSELAGNVFIMLKKSLSTIPFLGYGMRNYNFIFMNRKWEMDKENLSIQLGEIDTNARGVGQLAGKHSSNVTGDENQIKWPYALILFPEGTNLSANTRERSKDFATKNGLDPMNNVLLPRTTGLRFALQKLRPSCDAVYDVTIAYSGVKQNEYGQDIYNLGNIFLRGQSPKLVDIHIRAFELEEIPIDDEEKFTKWLFNVWEEKDRLMDTYYEKKSFDLDPELNHTITDFCRISPYEIMSILLLPVATVFFILWLLKNWLP